MFKPTTARSLYFADPTLRHSVTRKTSVRVATRPEKQEAAGIIGIIVESYRDIGFRVWVATRPGKRVENLLSPNEKKKRILFT